MGGRRVDGAARRPVASDAPGRCRAGRRRRRRAAGAGAREALLASPAAARWLRPALEPLRRAGREGYAPSTPERRRLAGARRAAPRSLGGWLLGRAGAGAAALGRRPGGAGLGDLQPPPPLPPRRSSARCRKSRPRSPTRSAPAARCAPRCRPPPRYLDGPPAAELARLGAELDLGAADGRRRSPAWRRRMRSERVDAFAAALLSQRLAGGDLAGLLRRFAAGAAERDRVAEDARSATAQARFTGLLVVAMPSGGALFAELIQPGFLATPARLAAGGGAARPRRRPAAGRLRRDPALLAGGRVSAGRRCSRRSRSCSAAAGAARAGCAGVAAAARRRPALPASASGAARPRAALRLGLPERLRRSGLEAAAAARRRCWPRSWRAPPRRRWRRSAAAPAAPGGLALLVALGAAGGRASSSPTRCSSARRGAATGACSAALPDALDLLAVSAGSGRGPAAGLEQLARAGEGPLAEELRDRRRRARLRRPARRRPARRCARASRAASWRPWSPRSSARAASARRSPSSCAARPSALRRDSRRAIEERAARAAPKIQLVVALVLVPSVLLMIAAGADRQRRHPARPASEPTASAVPFAAHRGALVLERLLAQARGHRAGRGGDRVELPGASPCGR